ncbi:hypothetical protein ACTHSZ_25000, partial [Neisseria sp. P0006.S006]
PKHPNRPPKKWLGKNFKKKPTPQITPHWPQKNKNQKNQKIKKKYKNTKPKILGIYTNTPQTLTFSRTE